jgi:hypothetical protein
MTDLTVLFLTLKKLPQEWQKYHKEVLLKAIGDAKLIEISPDGDIIQNDPPSNSNVYKQLLRGCLATDTEYIAVAEDDTLYPPDHFQYRPEKGTFAYNQSHWSLFTWGEPTYSWRDRLGNYTLIAHREDVIEALTERFEKYPNGTPEGRTGEIGRWRTDTQLGLTPRKTEEFKTNTPVINICHQMGLDDRANRQRKTLGTLRAYDIPYWGPAKELILNFK